MDTSHEEFELAVDLYNECQLMVKELTEQLREAQARLSTAHRTKSLAADNLVKHLKVERRHNGKLYRTDPYGDLYIVTIDKNQGELL